MKVLLAVSILCNILLHVFTLRCRKCLTLPNSVCVEEDCTGAEICKSILSVVDNVSHAERACSQSSYCGTSINTGHIQQTIECCETNLCNNHSLPERLSGQKCYGCTDTECSKSLKTVACTIKQQYCASGYFQGTYQPAENLQRFRNRFPFRGCVSHGLCAKSVQNIQNVKCCCGDLCNKSICVQQSIPLLVTVLLPFLKIVA